MQQRQLWDGQHLHSIGLSSGMDRSQNNSPGAVEVKEEPVFADEESAPHDSSSPAYESSSINELSAATGYSCQQCDTTLPTMSQFIAHMRMVHLGSGSSGKPQPARGSASCTLCGETFAHDRGRSAHMLEYYLQTSRTYTCTACTPCNAPREPSFSSHHQFKQHFAAAHIDVLYRCRHCLKLSTDFEHMKEHSISHVAEQERYRCVACDGSFPTEPLLVAHIESRHRAKEIGPSPTRAWRPLGLVAAPRKKEPPPPSSTAAAGRGAAPMVAKCTVCDAKLPDELALSEHKLVYHCKVKKSDRCMLCHFGLPDTDAFIAHSLHHFSALNSTLSPNMQQSCIVCRQTICGAAQLRMHAAYHALPPRDLGDSGEECKQHSLNMALDGDETTALPPPPLKSLFDEEIEELVGGAESKKLDGNARACRNGRMSQGGSTRRKLRCVKCRQSFVSMSSLIVHRRRHAVGK